MSELGNLLNDLDALNAEREAAKPEAPPTEAPPSLEAELGHEWDFRVAQTDPRGNARPALAQGWKPDGSPFFGTGLGGWLKELGWIVAGKPYGDSPQGENWKRIVELESLGRPATEVEKAEEATRIGGALFGTDVQTNIFTDKASQETYQKSLDESEQIRQNWGAVAPGQLRPDAPADVVARWGELRQQQMDLQASAATLPYSINGQKVSLFQPLLRVAEAAVKGIGDAASELAIKYEQMGGAAQAAREAAGESVFYLTVSGGLSRAERAFNFRADQNLKDWAQTIDIVTRQVNPYLQAWDTARLLTAKPPGEALETLSQGFDAGRVYV